MFAELFVRARCPHPRRSATTAQVLLLERRVAPAAAVQLQAAYLTSGSSNPVDAPIIGQRFSVTAKWTTTGLSAADTYTLGAWVDGLYFQSSSIDGATGVNVSESFYVGAWYAAPGTHTVSVTVDPGHTIANADESQATRTFTFTSAEPTTLPAKFVNPLGNVNTTAWTVTGYVDDDLRPGHFQNYAGEQAPYDGHTGLDLAVADFAAMDAGFPVYAALGGKVLDVQDGAFDRQTTWDTSNVPNYITIDNGNGWLTEYYHLAANTITVRAGDTVAAGQVLGLVGSSGYSTGPHLHFQVEHQGLVVDTLRDPSVYWADPSPFLEGNPRYVLDAGVSLYDPAADWVEQPESAGAIGESFSGQIWYWFRASVMGPADQVTVDWYRPDGTLEHEEPVSPSALYHDVYFDRYLYLAPDDRQAGTWHVTLRINGVEAGTSSFEITPGAGDPGLHVNLTDSKQTFIRNGRITAVDFGTANVGADPAVVTFNVWNTGTGTLELSNLTLPPQFTLTTPFPTTIAPGASRNFSVQLDTDVMGLQFGALSFTTNLPGESEFKCNVQGTITDQGYPAPSVAHPAAAYTVDETSISLDPGAQFKLMAPYWTALDSLTVSFASGGMAQDHLEIDPGTASPGLSISDGNLTLNNLVVGTVTGGSELQPLTISFNDKYSYLVLDALLRSLAFRTELPLTGGLRYVRFGFTDRSSNVTTYAYRAVIVASGTGGIQVPEGKVLLDPGGTTTTTVALGSQPTNDVTVNITGPFAGAVAPSTLTFTPLNWMTPQTVTIAAGPQDPSGRSPSGTLIFQSTSDDPAYQGLTLTRLINGTFPDSSPAPYQVAAGRTYTADVTEGLIGNIADRFGLPLLQAQLASPARHGTVTLQGDGSFAYAPAQGFVGSDTFQYVMTDGTWHSEPITVTLVVGQGPLAHSHSWAIPTSGALSVPAFRGVLADTSDASGRPVHAVLVSEPGGGTLVLNADGSFVYTPKAGFTGPDFFAFVADDGVLRSEVQVVTLTNGIPSPPPLPPPGDFDGDGKADPAVFEPSTSTFYIAQSTAGNVAIQFGIGTRFGGHPQNVSADYDGTGMTDPAVFEPSTSTFYIHSSRGNRLFQFGIGTRFGGNPIPVPADYDGDGVIDPAVFEPSTSTFYIARSLLGNVAIQFGIGTRYGGHPVPVPGNYEGDGVTDPAVFEPSTSTFYVARHRAPNEAIQFGIGTRYGGHPIPVPGNYEGDGLTDPAVFEPSTSTFYVARHGAANLAIQFGIGTRYGGEPMVIPADYDGDGRTDPAVFEPSTSTFYLARSSEGNQAVQFGIGTRYGGQPMPIPAGFDGNGLTIPAVFEPSTSTFYIAHTDGTRAAIPFGIGTRYGGHPQPVSALPSPSLTPQPTTPIKALVVPVSAIQPAMKPVEPAHAARFLYTPARAARPSAWLSRQLAMRQVGRRSCQSTAPAQRGKASL